MENENQEQNATEEVDNKASQPTEDDSKEEKTFTQDEVNELINKRLDRERKNQQAEIERAKNEATKLAKMNSDQKKEYELDKARKEAEQAKADLQRYQMRDEARKMLSENDLSLTDDQLALVVTGDAETTQERINLLASIAESIRENVRDDFRKGKTPRVNNDSITREDIEKIKDPKKRLEMIRTHLDLFNH